MRQWDIGRFHQKNGFLKLKHSKMHLLKHDRERWQPAKCPVSK